MSLKSMLDGRKAYSLHLTGNKLIQGGRYEEGEAKLNDAIALYQKSLDEGMEDTKILMAYSVLLLKRGDYEKARELMLSVERKRGLTPEDKRQLRMNYAICEWKRGNLDHAIQLMQEVARDFKNSSLYGSLGYMLIEKARETGDFSEAEAFNQEAYEYDDEDAVTLDNLGQLRLAQGRREEALDFFKRAIEQKPTQVDTLYYLGKLSHEEGKDEEAREYLDRALKGHYSMLCTTTREQAQALSEQLG